MKTTTHRVFRGLGEQCLLFVFLIVLLILATLLAACNGAQEKSPTVVSAPTVAIASPADGHTVQAGVDVAINSTASDAQGIVKVELWVDGSLYRVDTSPDPEGQTTFVVSQPWHADAPGSHSVVVRAYNKGGQMAESTAVTINVQAVAEVLPSATPTVVAVLPTDTLPPATDTPAPPSPTASLPPAQPTNTSPLPSPTPTSSPPPTHTPTVPLDDPPALEILSPVDEATVVRNVALTVQVRASDDKGIVRIELWADGVLYETHDAGGTTPVEADLTWQSGVLGDHLLELKVVDTAAQPGQTVALKVKVVTDLPDVPEPFAHVWTAVGGAGGRLGNPAAEAVLDRWVADQVFEGGMMYWRNNEFVPANYIYVLLYGGGTNQTQGTIWLQFEDLWREGMTEFSCPEAQANGALGPKRGFGKVWCEEATVKDGLKSPLELEQGVNAGFQDFEKGAMIWNARLGYVYVLYNDGDWLRFDD